MSVNEMKKSFRIIVKVRINLFKGYMTLVYKKYAFNAVISFYIFRTYMPKNFALSDPPHVYTAFSLAYSFRRSRKGT